MSRKLRSLGLVAFFVLVLGLAAGPAGATVLEGAVVNAQVQRDGSL